MATADRTPFAPTSPEARPEARAAAAEGSIALRWVTLLVVAASIAYSNLADIVSPGGSDIAEVSRRYENAFTPAPYAFAIWGLIYASFLAYCVVALLPSRRGMEVYDRLSGPVMFANLLGALWVATFRHDMILASVVVIVAMLALAWHMLAVASRYVDTGRARFTLTVPFALFFGWISVATLADLAALRMAFGGASGGFTELALTSGMLAFATALALGVGLIQRQFIVPAVVAWSATAIAVASSGPLEPGVRMAAISAAVVCGIAAIALAVNRAWIRRPAQLVSGTLGTPLSR